MYQFYNFGICPKVKISHLYGREFYMCFKIRPDFWFVKFDWILFLIENLVVTNVWHGGDGRSWG